MEKPIAAEPGPLEAWKRLQRQLLEKEKALGEIAVLHARGDATAAELDRARHEAELVRDLTRTAFDNVLYGLHPGD